MELRSSILILLAIKISVIYHCCVYREKLLMMDKGTVRNVQFYSKNKYEKLVHLVGFIIRIYNCPLGFWLLFCCCQMSRTFKNPCFVLQCPTHSWYLMVDMQLYTISPYILLFLLVWNKNRCLVTLCVLASMGLTVSFLVNYLLELPAGFMSGE